MPHKPTTLHPGDYGLVVKKSGKIDILLPDGQTGMSHIHAAVIGAAVKCQSDPAFAAERAAELRLAMTPAAGSA